MKVDPVLCGVRRGLLQGAEQIGVEVGHGWNLVIKDSRAVGNETVSLAKCTALSPDGRVVRDGRASLAR
jgi:hypothetical protein